MLVDGHHRDRPNAEENVLFSRVRKQGHEDIVALSGSYVFHIFFEGERLMPMPEWMGSCIEHSVHLRQGRQSRWRRIMDLG